LGAKRCIPTGLCTLAPSASGPKIICGCLSAGHAGERSKSASLPKTQLPAPKNGRAHSSDHPTSLAPSQSITALRVPRGKEDGGRRLRAPAPKGTPPPGPPQRVKAALRTVAERRSKQGRGSQRSPPHLPAAAGRTRPHPVTGRARGSYPRCRWFGKAWPSTAKARLVVVVPTPVPEVDVCPRGRQRLVCVSGDGRCRAPVRPDTQQQRPPSVGGAQGPQPQRPN